MNKTTNETEPKKLTYNIGAVPAGAPSYVVESVQKQCDAALTSVFDPQASGAPYGGWTTEKIVDQMERKRYDELQVLRRAYDDADPNSERSKWDAACAAGGHPVDRKDFWLSWGYRTVTKAWENAVSLMKFREALDADDFSHVTNGHPVQRIVRMFNVYRRDHGPSGCMLAASIPQETPGAREILDASRRRTTQGGMRGEMAARRMMGVS